MRLWPWYKFADQPEAGVYELVAAGGVLKPEDLDDDEDDG